MQNYTLKVRSYLVVLSLLTPLGMAACGGSAPSAEAPAADTKATDGPDPSTESPAAPEEQTSAKSFDQMSPQERLELMKTRVVPEMGQAFRAFDSQEFAEVNCTTCHGPGAKSGDFEMPTKSLPALDKEEMDEHPQMTKFMMEQVVPQMAAILGESPYNPETHEGFGCFDCHTQKGH
jgi:hypothetical protein